MAKSNDIASKLAKREERRKSSIIAGMVDAPPIIHKTEAESEKTPPTKAGKGIIVQKPEKKTRRKQIVLQPSVHDRAEEKCKQLGISMNEVINQLLRQWLNMK